MNSHTIPIYIHWALAIHLFILYRDMIIILWESDKKWERCCATFFCMNSNPRALFFIWYSNLWLVIECWGFTPHSYDDNDQWNACISSRVDSLVSPNVVEIMGIIFYCEQAKSANNFISTLVCLPARIQFLRLARMSSLNWIGCQPICSCCILVNTWRCSIISIHRMKNIYNWTWWRFPCNVLKLKTRDKNAMR